MRWFDRHDAVLFIGLIGAVLVVFGHPLVRALDLARNVDDTSGLALLPGLAVLMVALLLQQHGKWQYRLAQNAAGAVARSRQRAGELEELVVFGRSLARAQDLEAVRDAVLQHLCRLAGSDATWVMFHLDADWNAIVGASPDGVAVEERYGPTADRAVTAALSAPGLDALELDGCVCLPMFAAGAPIGVVGIPGALADLPEARRRLLTTAAALLAISVKNVNLFREMRDQSLRDGLTGCFNRTYAIEAIEIELRRSRRVWRPVSLIMFDLDQFKEINDRFGHLCGDRVLADVGRLMRDVLRTSDVKCRYGGDEFLVLLPETSIEGARRVAEGLRRDIGALAVEWNGETIAATGSFGLATAPRTGGSAQDLIAAADAALYAAKSSGGNSVNAG